MHNSIFRSIFTEHENERVPLLTPFETFEHDTSSLDSCATNEAMGVTNNIDEELLAIENFIKTNVSDTWSINNEASEDEDDSTDEKEEVPREKTLTPSSTIGLSSSSVSDEPRVTHIEFTEAAAGRNRSRNVARRGRRPSYVPRYSKTTIINHITHILFICYLEHIECTY